MSSFRTIPPTPDHCYTIRRSGRARHLQLRVSNSGRVEVVVPVGADVSLVPAFVEKHRHWLERTVARILLKREQLRDTADFMPGKIRLPAIGEEWDVHYQDGQSRPVVAAGSEARLLRVAAGDAHTVHAGLRGWLAARAKATLVPWLRQVSDEVGLPFEKVAVRAQKSRWGSCSARKNININRSLLFLDRPVVRYLFVHELCHTVHMNHSARYWKLVEKLEPNYRELDGSLRDAASAVPLWAHPD